MPKAKKYGLLLQFISLILLFDICIVCNMKPILHLLVWHQTLEDEKSNVISG